MYIEAKENFPVKNLTSFKIGGAVEKFYLPKNEQEFVYLLKTLYDPIIMGNWSNVLISSAGIKGAVISTSKLDKVSVDGNKIIAQCGVKGPKIAQIAVENGLGGFEFMSGFPGTIGGNIYMNASAHQQCISDHLLRVHVLDMSKKEILTIEKQTLNFAYRSSILQRRPYILLSAEYIIQNLGSIEKDEIEEFTKMINDSSEKAYTLLEEILLWLKVQSGQLSVQKTKIELRNIVLNIIENLSPLAQNKSIKLNCNIPQDVYIEADINMFKTILRNLITNSIKFTNENGEIEVNIEEIEKRIMIIVADNGVGMSQDLAKNLFTDQVNQTEEGTKGEKGTGLGLTIIKELVQKHKELIWAESEIGKGSRFIVTMPKITKKDEETI